MRTAITIISDHSIQGDPSITVGSAYKLVGLNILCVFCGHPFLICRKCYRGHSYCSVVCRREGYRKTQMSAQRNYEKTFRAKRCHAARQARYRMRQQNKVTHKSSTSPPAPIEQARIRFEGINVCCRCGADIFIPLDERNPWKTDGHQTQSKGHIKQESSH